MHQKFDEIVAKIRQKRELSGIDSSLVSDLLEKYIKKAHLSLEGLSGSDIRCIVKDIRADLRNYVGRFQIGQKHKQKLLREGDFEDLLKTHSSTKERIGFYPELRKLIYSLKPKSILDLGCGLNPIALASQKVKYYASDINTEELDLVRKFFEKKAINGETFICDLRNIEACPLPRADICLIFKVLDIIEKNGHKIAEKIIIKIPSRYLLVSFSTRKLSGKPMSHPQREWIELLLRRLNYHFTIISSENEIFYLISKQPS